MVGLILLFTVGRPAFVSTSMITRYVELHETHIWPISPATSMQPLSGIARLLIFRLEICKIRKAIGRLVLAWNSLPADFAP